MRLSKTKKCFINEYTIYKIGHKTDFMFIINYEHSQKHDFDTF